MLETAKLGVYPRVRLQGISEALLQRYLVKERGTSTDSFRFRSDIRSMIDFEHLNLMASLPTGYCCSVIFCRNIMIYFDKPTQQALVSRLVDHLEPGGYLLIGHSENLNGIDHGLTYIQPATYRKCGALAEPSRKRSPRDSR